MISFVAIYLNSPMFIYFLSPFIHNDCLSAVQRLIAKTFGNFADRGARHGAAGESFSQRGGGRGGAPLDGGGGGREKRRDYVGARRSFHVSAAAGRGGPTEPGSESSQLASVAF